MKLVTIGPVVSEESRLKLWMDDDDGRRTTEPSHPISSPGAFGSGELKKNNKFSTLISGLTEKFSEAKYKTFKLQLQVLIFCFHTVISACK